MFLNKIESVGVDQTILGRMLGYGDIKIRGTGGSLEPFRHVSSPLQFRNQIQEQIGKSFHVSVASSSCHLFSYSTAIPQRLCTLPVGINCNITARILSIGQLFAVVAIVQTGGPSSTQETAEIEVSHT